MCRIDLFYFGSVEKMQFGSDIIVIYSYGWRGGLVVGRRTCDLVVAGSRLDRDAAA